MTSRDPSRAPASHPDELLLAGWAEGRLLDFERAPVEEHLAQCRSCRDLAASLAAETGSVRAARTAPASRLRILRPVLLAAAAVLVVSLLWMRGTGGPPASFELALAGSRDAVFTELRSAPEELERLFVGLRLTDPGWVRLVAVDGAGGIEPIPLDPGGADALELAGDSDHVFGPYPTRFGEERVLVAVVALLARAPVPWSAVRESGWRGSLEPADLRDLREALGARVRVQRVR